jgi:hypothetical protein
MESVSFELARKGMFYCIQREASENGAVISVPIDRRVIWTKNHRSEVCTLPPNKLTSSA